MSFCFIISKAGCKDTLFFMECAVEILRLYCFEELKLSHQSCFRYLIAKLVFYLMFDLPQYGKAAIHYAAKGGHQKIIRLLIENSVDPNVKTTEVRN